MRRLLTLALIQSLSILFIACGGDDGQPAPPVPLQSMLAPGSINMADDLRAKIDALKNGACDGFSQGPLLMLAATQSGKPLNSVFPLLQSLNGGGNCNTTANNAIYLASHMFLQNGQPWIDQPAARLYLAKQLIRPLNRIMAPFTNAGLNQNQIINQFGPGLRVMLDSGFNNLGIAPQIRQSISAQYPF